MWGLKPIAQHLRMVPDFASFRGMLVLGGNQVSSIFDNNLVTGQSQSGLWFGATDSLWSMGGKPQGWGGPWRYDIVLAGVPSDAYLMTGFDKKVAHFRIDPPAANFATRNLRSAAGRGVSLADRAARGAPAFPGPISITIQVDFDGAAGHRGGDYTLEPWNTLATIVVNASADLGASYAHYTFEPGFSAHWVRFIASGDCNATAWLTYT